MKPCQSKFIEFLLETTALRFGDFTLKSGRQCPYFINAGLFNTGKALATLGKFYADSIQENFQDADVIYGPAYKGIPLAVSTCTALWNEHQKNINYVFNRKEPKGHGEGGIFVGASLSKENRLVIVDDVMTAGTALKENLPLLKDGPNPKIEGVLIAVDRQEKGSGEKSSVEEISKSHAVKIISIVNMSQIIALLENRLAAGNEIVSRKQLDKINDYRRIYGVLD